MNKTIQINGNTVDWQEGMSVREALKVMNYSFPMIVIKLNGTLVLKSAYDSTLIPAGAELMVIHMISGGSGFYAVASSISPANRLVAATLPTALPAACL